MREYNKDDVKQLRESMGLSQEKFAAKIHVTARTINRWETGKFRPSILANEKLNILAKKFKFVVDNIGNIK